MTVATRPGTSTFLPDDMLARFGFDSYVFACDIKDLGQALANRPLIGTELGLLSEYNAVQVD